MSSGWRTTAQRRPDVIRTQQELAAVFKKALGQAVECGEAEVRPGLVMKLGDSGASVVLIGPSSPADKTAFFNAITFRFHSCRFRVGSEFCEAYQLPAQVRQLAFKMD